MLDRRLSNWSLEIQIFSNLVQGFKSYNQGYNLLYRFKEIKSSFNCVKYDIKVFVTLSIMIVFNLALPNIIYINKSGHGQKSSTIDCKLAKLTLKIWRTFKIVKRNAYTNNRNAYKSCERKKAKEDHGREWDRKGTG